ncbi:protein modification by small protein conjugation or removal [Coemansia erecta]|nr:protein modification by small protein conjugation or removal [Coemansia erecta]
MTTHNLDNTELELPSVPLLQQKRESIIDFGGLGPHYSAPMYYPTEVELYEPSVGTLSTSQRKGNRQATETVQMEVPVACGYFNIWRALHDRRTPVASRLARFFAGSAAMQHNGRVVAPHNSIWDSRILYSSADDEYYENGHALPFIKGWDHGMLSAQSLFRKVEHDWMMAYLSPVLGHGEQQSLGVWRFNYAASRRTIERFHAVLSFSLFSESADIEWCVRPLSKRQFRRIPVHLLAPEETVYFSEIATDVHHTDDSLEQRMRIINKYRGKILAYRGPGNEHNEYVIHSVPNLAADLSEYVEGEYGFELAVAAVPAAEGSNRWQKVQIARQELRQTVSGRLKEGEDVMSRCGLDFRIKLRDDIVVPPVLPELVNVLAGAVPEQRLRMDGPGCNFTIRVCDPENTVGILQPPIRAHEKVLRAGSEYFAALLESDMTEAASMQVVLDGMPYGPVRLAIYFLYADNIPRESEMDLNDWIALLGVASFLSIARLHQLCQARILREVTSDSPAALQESSAPGSYKDLVSYPDLETIESLQTVANDTGARDLAQALDRLVAYYPIEVCEERIRSDQVNQFIPQTSHGFRMNDDMPDHRFQLNQVRGPFGHGPFGHNFEPVDGDQLFMPGPVVHPEIAPGIVPIGGNGRDVPEDGFLGRLLGNWRLTNVQNNGHADPPAPQPGPVPDIPHITHAHVPHNEPGAESESESE